MRVLLVGEKVRHNAALLLYHVNNHHNHINLVAAEFNTRLESLALHFSCSCATLAGVYFVRGLVRWSHRHL